jgi:hypothetical protein
VPATAFCEYSQTPDPMTKKKPKIWFAIDASQPLFFFAGIWTNWSGVLGSMKTLTSRPVTIFDLFCDGSIFGKIRTTRQPIFSRQSALSFGCSLPHLSREFFNDVPRFMRIRTQS